MPDADFRLLEFLLLFAFIGVVSGFASGLFGIGGGIMRIPIFILLFPPFGIHGTNEMKVAAATSLALAVPSSILSMRKHAALGNFNWSYYRAWGAGLMVGVGIGILVTPLMSEFALKIAFLIFVILMILYFGSPLQSKSLSTRPLQGIGKAAASIGIGGYCTSIGIAGGSLATPVMKLFGSPMTKALALGSGTSAIISSLGMAGGIYNGWGVQDRPAWSLGYVDLLIFAVMLPGAVLLPGLGVGAANQMNPNRLRKIYAGFLSLIAASVVWHLFS